MTQQRRPTYSKPEKDLPKLPRFDARYNHRRAMIFCYEIAQNSTRVQAAERAGINSEMTIYQWLKDEPDFREAYEQAKEMRAHKIFDHLQTLSRTANAENAAAVKLMVNTDQWILGRLLPKVYGDRIDGDFNVNMSLERLVLDAIELRQKEQKQKLIDE